MSRFAIDQAGNPVLRANELFPAVFNLGDPRVADLRRRFAIDEVVAGVDGEFARILALRHWIARRIAIENDHPTEVEQHATAILASAAEGGRFHCAHFSLVQEAVLNAYGHVARRLGVGPGTLQDGRHHGVNEVWVNELAKWVVVDAKYDLHFELAGLPLSALEIRDQVLRDGGSQVRLVYGPDRREGPQRGSESAEFYRWLSWEPDSARFTSHPSQAPSSLIVLDDESFRSGTWIRDGRPHWAYDAGFFIRTVHRSWIEWTPNVVACQAGLDGSRLHVRLASCTPGLATYQMSPGDAPWSACGDALVLDLPHDGLALRFRAVNRAGVAGPIHRFLVRPPLQDGRR